MESLETRRRQLSAKAHLLKKTQLYWLEAAGHDNFDYIDQQMRDAFNQCLKATSKLHEVMRVLKLREHWNKHNDNFVINNRMTKQGVIAYWKGMDSSFQFNINKQEEYIVRTKFKTLCNTSGGLPQAAKLCDKLTVSEDFQDACFDWVTKPNREDHDHDHDEVCHFVKKRSQDCFHWSRHWSTNNRFILP